MEPISTGHPQEFVYNAPPGQEDVIGGLPCIREHVAFGGTAIVSVWEPTEDERAAIAAGANLRLGIYGMEPDPASLVVRHAIAYARLGLLERQGWLVEIRAALAGEGVLVIACRGDRRVRRRRRRRGDPPGAPLAPSDPATDRRVNGF